MKSKYKHNIVKHLKMCTDLKWEGILLLTRKYVPSAPKFLLRKQIGIVHSQDLADDIAFDEFDNQHNEQEQNQTMSSVVTSIEKVSSKVSQSFPTEVSTNHPEEEIPHLIKMKTLNQPV